MKKYVITGKKPLKGTVSISGSKNAALPLLAASLLTNEDVTLHNMPVLRDTETMIELLAMLGKKVIVENEKVVIKSTGEKKYKATYDIVKQMRASIVVLGPLLARYKKAHVSLPGGCAFGPRPVDLHLKGLEALGATICMKHGYIDAVANPLVGGRFNMMGEFGTSVLGTDNIAMAATLAKGSTIIENAAREPETEDLMHMLTAMGAKISGIGTSILTIEGVKELHGCEYTIIPDRIEAGTFAIIAAATGSQISLKYNRPEHLEPLLDLFKECGIGSSYKNGVLTITGKNPASYKPFKITTLPYPGFPTDMQSLVMVLGCVAPGISFISEGIYPNRFNHVPEFNRMGANIEVDQNTAIMKECVGLQGATVQASDLRAGASLVIAALCAEGKSEVRRVYHIERGYEDFVAKLKKIGASIREAKDTLI